MKAIFVSLLLLTCCAHTQPKERDVEQIEKIDTETRMLSTYHVYRNAGGQEVKHGSFVLWYDNGAKYIDATYADGKLDGKYVVFSDDGRELFTGYYLQGAPWQGYIQLGHEICEYRDGHRIRVLLDEEAESLGEENHGSGEQ